MSTPQSFRHSNGSPESGSGAAVHRPESGLRRRSRQLPARSPSRHSQGVLPPLHGSGQPEAPRRQGIQREFIPCNNQRFQALNQCQGAAERRRLRDAIVRDNLPLVYAIVARMGPIPGLSCEDLRQIGSEGLVKAVDAFDPSRGGRLSSFAVPYIRGAIQRELRDRHSLIRVPRELWDLRRRASALLDRRRTDAEFPLGPQQLADALGCDHHRLVEALQLDAVTGMRSLDAPLTGEAEGDGPGYRLLDTVPDPRSLAGQASEAGQRWPAASDGSPVGCDRRWLDQTLSALEPRLRRLVIGRCDGRSWVELGQELDLHPRQAQRLAVATLARLQVEGRHWREARDGGDASPLTAAA